MKASGLAYAAALLLNLVFVKLLGLTGDIASGKSTVARLLVARGAHHLDADVLVRELYADPEFAARLAARFGEVRQSSGAVDRAKLAPLVLADDKVLRELEQIVHPAVAALRQHKLDALEKQGVEVVVIEAVKLLESGQGAPCDEIWCVTARPAVQLQRLMENRGLSQEQARQRLANQPPRAAKESLAGAVPLVWLDNSGSLAELEQSVARQWKRLDANAWAQTL